MKENEEGTKYGMTLHVYELEESVLLNDPHDTKPSADLQQSQS
jgi:hypothetical protein